MYLRIQKHDGPNASRNVSAIKEPAKRLTGGIQRPKCLPHTYSRNSGACPPPPSPKCWWDSNISEARLHTPCGARTRRSRHAISIKHPSILYWSYTKNLTKTHIMHHLPKTSLCNTCGKNATIALRHRQRAKTLHGRARYGTDARYGDGAEEETADPGPATARRVYKTIRLKALRGWSLKAIHWGIARKLCFRVGLRVGLAAFEAW